MPHCFPTDFTTEQFPLEAVIVLNVDDSKATPGHAFRFICTISTFMLFNTMEFSREFLNGSIIIDDGFHVWDQRERTYTAFQRFSVALAQDVVRITCSAPMRNAVKRATASLGLKEIEKLLTRSNHVDGLTPISVYSKIFIFTAVLMASVSLLCVLYATRKYRQSKVLDLAV